MYLTIAPDLTLPYRTLPHLAQTDHRRPYFILPHLPTYLPTYYLHNLLSYLPTYLLTYLTYLLTFLPTYLLNLFDYLRIRRHREWAYLHTSDLLHDLLAFPASTSYSPSHLPPGPPTSPTYLRTCILPACLPTYPST